MNTTAWLLLSTLLGCGGQEPMLVLEAGCEACGRGEEVLQGCDSCFQIAEGALAQTRPNIDKARSFYAKGCQVHHPNSCQALALMVRDGKGGPRDLKRAADLFGVACEKGDLQKSCTELALAMFDGSGKKQDQEGAVALFEQACGHETDPQAKACAAWGLAFMLGKGVERKDDDRAIELLTKSCEMDYAPGCVSLADLYIKRRRGSTKENREIAAETYERACTLDKHHGCYELAVMHDEDKAPNSSAEKAAIYYQMTCSVDPTRGCYEAAELMASDRVTARAGEIESLYNVACEHGHGEACAKRVTE